MRKFLLSFIVIGVFGIYALREDDDKPKIIVQAPIVSPKPITSNNKYRDGQYTGPVTDALYGNVQVKATISGGKLVDVVFLDYPKDRSTSREISNQAMPILKSEAISAQSAQVDVVSGATQTSRAFIESLTAALNDAI